MNLAVHIASTQFDLHLDIDDRAKEYKTEIYIMAKHAITEMRRKANHDIANYNAAARMLGML